MLPGYQPVSDDAKRAAVARGWGRRTARGQWPHRGRDDARCRRPAGARHVRHGRKPHALRPQPDPRGGGLRALDFLVVQDIFLSETALLAHVVLPAAASLEEGRQLHQHRAARAVAHAGGGRAGSR
ncbi:MAG: molybdopterin-dependent oxidoreductase [Caldilineaceae bacterium]